MTQHIDWESQVRGKLHQLLTADLKCNVGFGKQDQDYEVMRPLAFGERVCYYLRMNPEQQIGRAPASRVARRGSPSEITLVAMRRLSYFCSIQLIPYSIRIQFLSKCVLFPKALSYEMLQKVTECYSFPGKPVRPACTGLGATGSSTKVGRPCPVQRVLPGDASVGQSLPTFRHLTVSLESG